MPDLPIALFAKDFSRLGPWLTLDALKGAIRRGVLREGWHFEYLGGRPVFYPQRIFTALQPKEATHEEDKASRVLRHLINGSQGKVEIRVESQRTRQPANLEHGRRRHQRKSAEVGEGEGGNRSPA